MKLEANLERRLSDLQRQLALRSAALTGLPRHELDFVRRQALVSTIGASTRIENAVLTDAEVDWVDTTLARAAHPDAFEERRAHILDKLSKDRERSVEEVAGCREMLGTILTQHHELLPLSQTTIRGLHAQLLRHYPEARRHAGAYKTVPNRVVAVDHSTNASRVVLEPALPGAITETAMAELVEWYRHDAPEYPWPLVAAAELVFRFLAIHPFQDGNGRLGRGLFLLALLQSGDPGLVEAVPCVSIDRHIEQHRARYYAVLRKVSGGVFDPDPAAYDLRPFVDFLVRITRDALTDIDVYRERYQAVQSLSEAALEVLNAFKSSPGSRLAVGQLAQTTDLPRRTIQYSIRQLVRSGLLQRLGMGRGTRYQLVF